MGGAVVLQIKGNFDEGMQLVKEVANEAPVTIVNSINPFRLQGQKTAAFEIIEELGRAPDFHCLPVGNAGNITAHWIGYSEFACNKNENVTITFFSKEGKKLYNTRFFVLKNECTTKKEKNEYEKIIKNQQKIIEVLTKENKILEKRLKDHGL